MLVRRRECGGLGPAAAHAEKWVGAISTAAWERRIACGPIVGLLLLLLLHAAVGRHLLHAAVAGGRLHSGIAGSRRGLCQAEVEACQEVEGGEGAGRLRWLGRGGLLGCSRRLGGGGEQVVEAEEVVG